MANTIKTIEQIRSAEGTVLTPYEVFRILQAQVSEAGLTPPKPLRPQFVYNYDRNGMIVKGYNMAARDGLAGRYSVEQAEAWAAKYIQSNKHKWTGTSTVQVVDPFAVLTGTDPEDDQIEIDFDEIDA
jgi:hypothetical protein